MSGLESIGITTARYREAHTRKTAILPKNAKLPLSGPCQDSNPYTLQKAKDDHGIRTWEGEHLLAQIPPISPASCSFVIEAARLDIKIADFKGTPRWCGWRVQPSETAA